MKKFVCLVSIFVLATVFSCATKPVQQKAGNMPDPHAGIFAQKCAKCHDLSTVAEAHKTKTRKEMKDILKKMHDKPDSDIALEDYEELLLYY